MTTDNKSPSYLEERERARRFFLKNPEGKFALETLKQQDPIHKISRVMDDDTWTNWGDMVDEHKDDLTIAASCAEARAAVSVARQSNSALAAPVGQGSKMLRFFSPPLWYVLRRQIEIADPECWNDPKFVLREAIANPQWATVPLSYLRGALDALQPKSREIIRWP